MKLILGKHNLSAPITSYGRHEVVVKSQSYFFTHSVKAMAVTQTSKGITSKQLLIGTIGDQVCCKFFVIFLTGLKGSFLTQQ
jgi:ER membrane protein complex subunit 1